MQGVEVGIFAFHGAVTEYFFRYVDVEGSLKIGNGLFNRLLLVFFHHNC